VVLASTDSINSVAAEPAASDIQMSITGQVQCCMSMYVLPR